MRNPPQTISNPDSSFPGLPSDQKFGWFFCVVFIAASGWFAWTSSSVLSAIFGVVAVAVAILALATPSTLRPLNRLWYRLGLLLGKIVSPFVLGVIFFILITPISLIMRLFHRDELKMKKRPVDSYWIARSPPGPSSDSFQNQY